MNFFIEFAAMGFNQGGKETLGWKLISIDGLEQLNSNDMTEGNRMK